MPETRPVLREIRTSLGLVQLEGASDPTSVRPVLAIIPSIFASNEPLTGIPASLDILADACRVLLPGVAGPRLDDNSIAGMARAIGEALETAFGDRPVVLCGISIGGVVARAASARNLKRIIALDPPLAPSKLWPLQETLHSAPPTASPLMRFLHDHFGAAAPDHGWVIDASSLPADVVLSGQPLMPPRQLPRLPSLVDPAERGRLAAHPRIRLHAAADAGHDLLGEALPQVTEVMREACRRAAAVQPFDATKLDEALLEATPLAPARVAYWGPAGDVFAAAYLARAPGNELVPLDTPTAGGRDDFDVVVAGGASDLAAVRELGRRLRPGGWLVIRWGDANGIAPEILQTLAESGLRPVADTNATGVIRLQKAAHGRVAPTPLRVECVAFASLLMDIRTRLPAQALASDPGLTVHYGLAPWRMPAIDSAAPKVLVLQRPGDQMFDARVDMMAKAIVNGWLVIVEFDDHPQAIADFFDKPLAATEWDRFIAAHAVQTSTPPLVEALQAYNPEVRGFENAVFDVLPFPNGERPRRVFYGAVQRGAYAVEVARRLQSAIAAFPDLEFVVMGDEAVFEALPTTRKRRLGYMSYEAYLGLMSECCVSLSPVDAQRRFQDTKSDAKFLDAARAGVVTIASPTIYERTVEHGVNGLLARSIDAWAPLLTETLSRPDWRRAMGRRAWTYVRDHRMFAYQIGARRDWYRELWARRHGLNEAVMTRVPAIRRRVADLQERRA